MLIFEENEEQLKMILDKWQKLIPEINVDQALKCEKLYIDYVNGKISEEKYLKDTNGYLIKQGLIKKQ